MMIAICLAVILLILFAVHVQLEINYVFPLLFCVLLPFTILVYRFLTGQLFTILTIYTAFFFMELLGGLFMALGNQKNSPDSFSRDIVFTAAVLLTAGYIFFLAGYYFFFFIRQTRGISLPSIKKEGKEFNWLKLFLLIALAVYLGSLQVLEKISSAGGFINYLGTMYLYRFGTYSETDTQNAIIVFGSLFGSLGLSFFLVGYMKNLRQKQPKIIRMLLGVIFLTILITVLLTTFRNAVIFFFISLVAAYNCVRPIKQKTINKFVVVSVLLLILINFIHQQLYALTAGWEEKSFTETLGDLIAPHNHLLNFCDIVKTSYHKSFLHGKNLIDCFLFFVPRQIWPAKSDNFGTIIVQQWADMPDWYQIAVTNTGEFFAHFGLPGIALIFIVGIAHGWMETFSTKSIFHQAVFYGLFLARAFGHLGMGLSALTITFFQAYLFLWTTRLFLSKEKNTSPGFLGNLAAYIEYRKMLQVLKK